MAQLPPSLWNIPQRFVSITHQLGRSWRRDVIKMTPEQIRTTLDGLSRLYPGQFGVTFEQVELAGISSAKIYCAPALHRDKHRPDRILMAHGGGFAFGSARTHRALATSLAKKCQAEIYIPDYSLAPETPFPFAIHELLACYDELCKEEGRIWLMGDSAGANLASALLNEVIAKQGKSPAGLLLLSPWLDLRPASRSNTESQSHWSPFERLDMLEYATHYLQGQDASNPKASPLLASFAEWPPVYLEASKVEYLWHDAENLAEELDKAEVPFEFRIEPAALHGWQLFPDILPEAKRSIDKMVGFILQHSN
ncbi:alpha/beta hydrolase [Flavobacteriales bacterium]|nr:alpha/beta hydrolase [Flavobacteriales bacterium]